MIGRPHPLPTVSRTVSTWFLLSEKSHFFHVHLQPRLKKIQEKKKILRKKAEEAKKAKGITNGET